MPTPRATGHRIRAGTQTVGNITSTYAVSALPTQTDQGVVEWVIDGSSTTYPEYARVVINLDGSASADGPVSFQWNMTYMTEDMMSHWLTTFLPSGVYSAAVSVMTYDPVGTAVYLNCKLYRPNFSEAGGNQFDGRMSSAQYAFGGYRNVIWRFGEGTIIT
jgi:hypothetical protein